MGKPGDEKNLWDELGAAVEGRPMPASEQYLAGKYDGDPAEQLAPDKGSENFYLLAWAVRALVWGWLANYVRSWWTGYWRASEKLFMSKEVGSPIYVKYHVWANLAAVRAAQLAGDRESVAAGMRWLGTALWMLEQMWSPVVRRVLPVGSRAWGGGWSLDLERAWWLEWLLFIASLGEIGRIPTSRKLMDGDWRYRALDGYSTPDSGPYWEILRAAWKTRGPHMLPAVGFHFGRNAETGETLSWCKESLSRSTPAILINGCSPSGKVTQVPEALPTGRKYPRGWDGATAAAAVLLTREEDPEHDLSDWFLVYEANGKTGEKYVDVDVPPGLLWTHWTPEGSWVDDSPDGSHRSVPAAPPPPSADLLISDADATRVGEIAARLKQYRWTRIHALGVELWEIARRIR